MPEKQLHAVQYLNMIKCVVTWRFACDLSEIPGHLDGWASYVSMEISDSEGMKNAVSAHSANLQYTRCYYFWELRFPHGTVASKHHQNRQYISVIDVAFEKSDYNFKVYSGNAWTSARQPLLYICFSTGSVIFRVVNVGKYLLVPERSFTPNST